MPQICINLDSEVIKEIDKLKEKENEMGYRSSRSSIVNRVLKDRLHPVDQSAKPKP